MSVTCYYRMRIDGITLYLVLIFSGAAGQANVPLRLLSNLGQKGRCPRQNPQNLAVTILA